MKRSNKKGFTIVELVIVIAIIAILAAVLIPTFASLIQKANESKDTQLVKNLNTALAADNTEHKTMTAALKAATEFGYDVGKINASATGNEILWDSENDVFCYLKDGNVEYIPESNATKPADYKLWKIYNADDKLEAQTYSIYWNRTDAFTAPLTVGFDAGSNTATTALTYKGTVGNSVVIRTNGGTLTVDAKDDSVSHYGAANLIDITAVKGESFHEFGSAAVVTVTSGRFVAESTAKVLRVHAATSTAKLAEVSGANVFEYTKADDSEIKVENSTKTVEKKDLDKTNIGIELVAEGGVAEINGIQFKDLQSAFNAAKDGDTVNLISDYKISDNVTDTVEDRLIIKKKITLNFGSYRVIGQPKMSEYNNNFTAIIVDADTTFVADENGGIFCEVSSEGIGPYGVNICNGAKLTVKGGTYFGGGTAIQVQKGELEILEGKFACAPYDEPYRYQFLINAYDPAFKDGSAKISIKGGCFTKFNPSNCKAEGEGTDFVADGYTVETNDEVYTVKKATK